MKEFLFQIKKALIKSAGIQARRLRRLFSGNKQMDLNSSFFVPIVINNRNRYTYLKKLVDWLQEAGYLNIIILDNDSTYPALLDYYSKTSAKVVYLRKNGGYKALWKSDFFKSIKSGFYVYTDPDVLPIPECPKELVYKLYLHLMKHKVEKCGPALIIDDLPDHYSHKQKVLQNERPFWENQVETDVYSAPIDTTFALYKPFAYGDAEDCKAIRVGGRLSFFHLPWYEDSSNQDAETRYYIEHAGDSSFWYKKVNKKN